MENGPIIPR
ncbi:unnamed protein product [Acanthoscelides obtectus]|uniref:Uncharacterized protein n=1 Tax=Acanthoscelides obtectus TaxID=200917 RepID=A0A9P0Q8Y5_ACAOB|nr:unnamed protein product [Acanthoscelides obtectus]CAK1667982.1 hypothetical protein AOBTE_LOCUS26160 [Acanthoscelides obtectus]